VHKRFRPLRVNALDGNSPKAHAGDFQPGFAQNSVFHGHALLSFFAIIRQKSKNVINLLKALHSTQNNEIYEKNLDLIIAQQDSLLQRQHEQYQIMKKQDSLLKKQRPKRFLKRLADAFSGDKDDITVTNNTEPFNNSNKEPLTNFDKKESLTKNDERSNEKSIETINSIGSIDSTKSTNPFSSLFPFLPSSIGPLSFNPDALVDNSIPIFEMFGIHLFLDDIT